MFQDTSENQVQGNVRDIEENEVPVMDIIKDFQPSIDISTGIIKTDQRMANFSIEAVQRIVEDDTRTSVEVA